jgi:hypothetical protein
MKSALPWILVVLLLGGGYFLYSANKEKEAALSQQSQELESLRAENADLKKLPAQQDEITRLRKENEDLVRLRAEVQRLNDESKKLTGQVAAAQAQAAQAKAAQSQALEAQQQASAENQALRNEGEKLKGVVSTLAKAVPTDPVSVCINQLRMIDGAKQTWALENKKQPTDVPTLADLTPYFPAGTQLNCPAGGAYAINAVNTPPTCSIPGHALH